MAAVDTPRFGRFARSATAGAFDAGSMPVVVDAGTPYQYAFFEFAPSTGLGMPTECGDGGVYAVLDGGQALAAIAFARASAAECYSNDGQTLTQLPAGQPRVSSGRIDSSVLGVYSDPTRANYMTYTRDCSNAAWAKTNTTCTKTATGMRGMPTVPACSRRHLTTGTSVRLLGPHRLSTPAASRQARDRHRSHQRLDERWVQLVLRHESGKRHAVATRCQRRDRWLHRR